MAFNKTGNRLLDLHLHALVAQGNHEAFLMIKKRYEKYAWILCKETLDKNQGTGITSAELVAVCMSSFKNVLIKYDEQQSAFYDFWLNLTKQSISDYILKNSYKAKAKVFNGIASFDYEEDERKINLEIIREDDGSDIANKLCEELLNYANQHREQFTNKEMVLIKCFARGYYLNEIMALDLMSRSTLYATFNSLKTKVASLFGYLDI